MSSLQSAANSIPKIEDECASVSGNVSHPASILHVGKYCPPHMGDGNTSQIRSYLLWFTDDSGITGSERHGQVSSLPTDLAFHID
jgi:hypothetical protein